MDTLRAALRFVGGLIVLLAFYAVILLWMAVLA